MTKYFLQERSVQAQTQSVKLVTAVAFVQSLNKKSIERVTSECYCIIKFYNQRRSNMQMTAHAKATYHWFRFANCGCVSCDVLFSSFEFINFCPQSVSVPAGVVSVALSRGRKPHTQPAVVFFSSTLRS